MKNILVPIDFSEASHNAAKYAVAFAKRFDAIVTLINVIPQAMIIDESDLDYITAVQAEIVESHKKLMEQEIEVLSGNGWIKIRDIVEKGVRDEVIQETAKSLKADMIVMGMKGKGKSNSFFGSTTTIVVRKSGFPVLLIPENVHYQTIENITFASDFDPDIDSDSYDLLIKMAEKLNVPVYILNVQKKDGDLTPEETIGKINTTFAFTGLHSEFHSISGKNVEEGIHTFIEKNPTDILAMVAHPHNVIERIFGTVHTKEMSYKTKIPLLVLPDK